MSNAIKIEICYNCKQHAWCTRHNEGTYDALSKELEKSIRNERPNIPVFI